MMRFLVFRRFCLGRFVVDPAVRFEGRCTMSTSIEQNESISTTNPLETQASSASTDDSEAVRQMCLTKMEQKILTQKRPAAVSHSRLLKVAIIGTPNAGKSTLANKLIGWKFAPVSQKVHTTRRKTLGVLTEENKQVIFLDTPGLIVPKKMKQHNLQRTLLVDPHAAVLEADLLAIVVDISHVWNRMKLDTEVLKILQFHADKKSILVMNKVDLIKDKRDLLEISRILTDGIVAGKKCWATPKHAKKTDLNSLFEKMEIQNAKENSKKADANIRESLEATDESSAEILEEDEAISDSFDHLAENEDAENVVDENLSNKENLEQDPSTVKSNLRLNLNDPTIWASYYKKIASMSKDLEEKRGWSHFDSVFMISALNGDGVVDLRDYLLDETYSSPLHFHPSVVTNQNPIALARLCIFERMLDHLPAEIPYQVKLKLSVWEVTEDNLLRVSFDLICSSKRHLKHVLGREGLTIRTIAAEAKQELMNAFRRELSLQLIARGVGDAVSKKHD